MFANFQTEPFLTRRHKSRKTGESTKPDIVIMEFARNLVFTNIVQPACLPSNPNFEFKCTVSGWGSTLKARLCDLAEKPKEYINHSDQLKEAQVLIQSSDFCENKLRDTCI